MSRLRWAALLAVYAAIAIAVTIVFSVQVPTCFGRIPDGRMSPECIAAWDAGRSLLDRVLGTPIGGVVVFALLAVATWAAVSGRQIRARAPGPFDQEGPDRV